MNKTMKMFHSTYYILVILCLTMVSCNTILMDEDVETSSNATEEALVKLTITFPSNATRAAGDPNEPEGTLEERYINDVQIYIFREGRFVEKAQYLSIEGNNGDNIRTIKGTVSKAYITGSAEVVLLTNTKAKGVKGPNLKAGVSTKADLYSQLVYEHKNQNWKENIPMWGVNVIQKTNEFNYSASINLTRAIAKVQVLVNDGQGLENAQYGKYFQIKNIKVVDHDTQGYCAPIKEGTPYIPDGTNYKTTMEFNIPNIYDGNYFVNKIYIPEHENLGNGSKVYLEITATAYGKDEIYKLYFKDNNNSECNVLRNHIYIFNIVSVELKQPPVNAELTYKVEDWGNIQIDIPPFGKEQ